MRTRKNLRETRNALLRSLSNANDAVSRAEDALRFAKQGQKAADEALTTFDLNCDQEFYNRLPEE